MKTILCKDCKWFRRSWLDIQRYSMCNSPGNQKSPVDGHPKVTLADLNRKFGDCGETGVLFEPRGE